MPEPQARHAGRRPLSPAALLIGAGLVISGVLIATLVIGPWLRPATQSSRLDLVPITATASGSPVARDGPLVATATTAPSPLPTTAPSATAVPSATPVPPTPTVVPPSPTPVPTARADSNRYLGQDPLPAGVDLSNGPFLKDLKARGYPGVNVGDGGLGDELKAAYLEALKVEEAALNSNDASRLDQYFTGEALTILREQIQRGQVSTDIYMDVVKYEARVMEFIPTTTKPGKYEVVDARTETITMVRKVDGKAGPVVRAGQPARSCYSVQILKEGGRWKVEFEEAHHDGPTGHKCPPGWS